VKLNEVAKSKVDWNTKSEGQQIALVKRAWNSIRLIDNPSEAVQLAAVTRDGLALDIIVKKGIKPSEAVQIAAVSESGIIIQDIRNPSEAVQLAAVNQTGYAIEFIKVELITQLVAKTALIDVKYIKHHRESYNEMVHKLFANNTVLLKKWLRYGEAMRSS
jgi:hypothetical protein